MKTQKLAHTDIAITPICLGTMTFGEQVDEAHAHAILDRALDLGINFLDTAEMYAVPARAATFNATERIIGNWIAARPGVREKLVIATKVAGPARGMPWIRNGATNTTAAVIIQACEDSLKRLQTDVIDLYQIHWPNRHVPAFGITTYNPKMENLEAAGLHEQLEALGKLVQAGKVRAIGVSNETPYGVHELVHLAQQHGLPRIATIQNPYNLVNRSFENALDETCHRLQVDLLAYSPLAFGLLTGKYDASGFGGEGAQPEARLTKFESLRKQRWGRPDALIAARRYNQLAQEHDLTPVQMALAFCYSKWQVASTIIGVTSVAQLEENVAAWGTTLSTELLAAIDAVRWQMRDPAM